MSRALNATKPRSRRESKGFRLLVGAGVAGEPVGAAERVGHLDRAEGEAQDLGSGDRGDGQVVGPKPQRRHAQEDREHDRGEQRDAHCGPEREVEGHDAHRQAVGADGHEACLAEVEQPGVAEVDVQSDRSECEDDRVGAQGLVQRRLEDPRDVDRERVGEQPQDQPGDEQDGAEDAEHPTEVGETASFVVVRVRLDRSDRLLALPEGERRGDAGGERQAGHTQDRGRDGRRVGPLGAQRGCGGRLVGRGAHGRVLRSRGVDRTGGRWSLICVTRSARDARGCPAVAGAGPGSARRGRRPP